MSKLGAKLLGVLVVLILLGAGWWTGFFASLSDAAAILITGLGAIIVAVLAIFTQRNIARRQCTLEHIAMLQADGDLIHFRVTFRELAKQPDGLAPWAAADKEQTLQFQ